MWCHVSHALGSGCVVDGQATRLGRLWTCFADRLVWERDGQMGGSTRTQTVRFGEGRADAGRLGPGLGR